MVLSRVGERFGRNAQSDVVVHESLRTMMAQNFSEPCTNLACLRWSGHRSECREHPGRDCRPARGYIRVIVNVPFPVQLGLPVSDHMPAIVFAFTVPVSARALPPGDPETTFIPNLPATFPLKFPLSAKVPLAVSPLTKQAELVEKLRLLILSELFELSVIVVLKAST